MTEKEPTKGNEISLTVKSQDGSVICFRLRKCTQLKKLMETFCSRSGLQVKAVRFMHEGERLKDTDTPDSLELEDGDEIDAMVEQHGGNSAQKNLSDQRLKI